MTKSMAMLRFVCWRLAVLLAGVIALDCPDSLAISGQSSQARQAKPAPARPSVSGEEVSEAKLRLSELGYWLNLEAKGLDASLRHALIAFQKIEGRPRTGLLTQEELQALRTASRPTARERDYPHIEIDLYRQVLYIVEPGEASLRVLPVSTGSGEYFTEGGVTRLADTPIGRFTIRRKIAGWRKSPLGLLYYPNYIYGGIAIHGNPSVPTEPKSHGCIRIPMFAAKEFNELATIGMVVLIYDSDVTPLSRGLPDPS